MNARSIARNAYDGLALGRVRAIRKRPANQRPHFDAPDLVRLEAGDTLSLQLSATDPDGDPVVFFAQAAGDIDVPPGSEIEDHHDGTATFRWPTKREHAGLHQLRVAAFDEGGGEVVKDITIAVCSRIVLGADVGAVVRGLFEAEPPAACREADVNRDQALSAADLVSAAASRSERD